MTHKQVADMLKTVGIPTAYYQFTDNTAQEPPFICFFYPDNDDIYADDSNYQKIERLVIELYTDNKDFTLESAVESVLKENGLTFTRAEQYLDSERMYEVIFETYVIITEELTDGE